MTKRGRKMTPCPSPDRLRDLVASGEKMQNIRQGFGVSCSVVNNWMRHYGIEWPKPIEIEGEEWRDVLGWEGLYEVSNMGRVRCLPRNGRQARIVKPYLNRKDYPRLMVSLINGRRKHGGREEFPTVHRIVLEAFVGPRPPGMEACHYNGDACDNRLANLRWDTKMGNVADRRRHEAERAYVDQ